MGNGNINVGGGWHLRKEVTVGQLLTTIGLIIGMVTYIVQNENRLATLEAETAALKEAQTERFDQMERWMAQQFADIKIELRALRTEVGDKADR